LGKLLKILRFINPGLIPFSKRKLINKTKRKEYLRASGYVNSCLKKLESNLSAKAILVKEASGHCRVVAVLVMKG